MKDSLIKNCVFSTQHIVQSFSATLVHLLRPVAWGFHVNYRFVLFIVLWQAAEKYTNFDLLGGQILQLLQRCFFIRKGVGSGLSGCKWEESAFKALFVKLHSELQLRTLSLWSLFLF